MRILLAIAFLLLVITIPATAVADVGPPPRPPVYGGAVTIDGLPVHDRVTISAWIDETLVAYDHAKNGGYAFTIPQQPGQSYEGRMITFLVGQSRAQQIDIWTADGGGERNLTVGP